MKGFRGAFSGAFKRERDLYLDPTQPLGRFLPQLHNILEGEECGLRDNRGGLMPPCIIMEKGEALDTWIDSSSASIEVFRCMPAPPCMCCICTV